MVEDKSLKAIALLIFFYLLPVEREEMTGNNKNGKISLDLYFEHFRLLLTVQNDGTCRIECNFLIFINCFTSSLIQIFLISIHFLKFILSFSYMLVFFLYSLLQKCYHLFLHFCLVF